MEFDIFGDNSEAATKLREINDKQLVKTSNCKYCKKPVRFMAMSITENNVGKEIIKWQCQTLRGENHSSLCLGSKDYQPRFTKGDIILSQWKEHSTMYVIVDVDVDTSEYVLSYKKKRHQLNRIPIKTIDKKSNRCDEGMVEAIFG